MQWMAKGILILIYFTLNDSMETSFTSKAHLFYVISNVCTLMKSIQWSFHCIHLLFILIIKTHQNYYLKTVLNTYTNRKLSLATLFWIFMMVMNFWFFLIIFIHVFFFCFVLIFWFVLFVWLFMSCFFLPQFSSNLFLFIIIFIFIFF